MVFLIKGLEISGAVEKIDVDYVMVRVVGAGSIDDAKIGKVSRSEHIM